ncbi:MAG: asparagine synthase (glutamine-hydrolyzing) [Planctomycetia bacterium]|nr:asparagine synthase (glutamine-hydrolyzing) [Planctomycetia bacterium]
MCGITGAAWTAAAAPLDANVLTRMTTALAHRGPDDACYYHSAISPDRAARSIPELISLGKHPLAISRPGAALGHRRLSIIDLAGGHQPLSNEDGSVWIAFNGEIYNYRELQGPLEHQGHRFRTSSDTETIVHLYEQYGTDCVKHLRGMFAFAIWDERQKQLFLARDRLGKKPFIYRLEHDRLLFASELKAILQVPGVSRELDPVALNEYLTYQYVPHPHSILKGFCKLPPAHWGMYRKGNWEVQRYWAPAFVKPEAQATSVTEEQARDTLRSTLTEAVRLRMRSDVPLGAFLSGGIDSTIVVGLMQQLSERPVKSFSIGFPVQAFDERSFARLAAEHLKTEHHEQVVEPSALAILPKLIEQYDEPFADSSAIPTMYLSEMTRRHVTVALSGDGGDELFAGYERYRAVKLAERFDSLPRFAQKVISSPIWQSLPASTRQKSRRRRLKRLLSALSYPPERRYLKWVSIFDDARLPDLWSDEFHDRLRGAEPAAFLLEAYSECPSRDFTTRTTCADVLTYLPCDILNKVDIASMTYGLEVRCPLLDQEVVDLAAGMPLEWKMRGGKGKRILIETFADLLPPAIQNRGKMGFGVPLDHWFRGELSPMLKDVLLDPKSLGRGLFRPQAIEQLITEHVTSRWDHSYRLWALLVLELWQQKYLDQRV